MKHIFTLSLFLSTVSLFGIKHLGKKPDNLKKLSLDWHYERDVTNELLEKGYKLGRQKFKKIPEEKAFQHFSSLVAAVMSKEEKPSVTLTTTTQEALNTCSYRNPVYFSVSSPEEAEYLIACSSTLYWLYQEESKKTEEKTLEHRPGRFVALFNKFRNVARSRLLPQKP